MHNPDVQARIIELRDNAEMSGEFFIFIHVLAEMYWQHIQNPQNLNFSGILHPIKGEKMFKDHEARQLEIAFKQIIGQLQDPSLRSKRVIDILQEGGGLPDLKSMPGAGAAGASTGPLASLGLAFSTINRFVEKFETIAGTAYNGLITGTKVLRTAAPLHQFEQYGPDIPIPPPTLRIKVPPALALQLITIILDLLRLGLSYFSNQTVNYISSWIMIFWDLSRGLFFHAFLSSFGLISSGLLRRGILLKVILDFAILLDIEVAKKLLYMSVDAVIGYFSAVFVWLYMNYAPKDYRSKGKDAIKQLNKAIKKINKQIHEINKGSTGDMSPKIDELEDGWNRETIIYGRHVAKASLVQCDQDVIAAMNQLNPITGVILFLGGWPVVADPSCPPTVAERIKKDLNAGLIKVSFGEKKSGFLPSFPSMPKLPSFPRSRLQTRRAGRRGLSRRRSYARTRKGRR